MIRYFNDLISQNREQSAPRSLRALERVKANRNDSASRNTRPVENTVHGHVGFPGGGLLGCAQNGPWFRTFIIEAHYHLHRRRRLPGEAGDLSRRRPPCAQGHSIGMTLATRNLMDSLRRRRRNMDTSANSSVNAATADKDNTTRRGPAVCRAAAVADYNRMSRTSRRNARTARRHRVRRSPWATARG
jgi:hypothetical protein